MTQQITGSSRAVVNNLNLGNRTLGQELEQKISGLGNQGMQAAQDFFSNIDLPRILRESDRPVRVTCNISPEIKIHHIANTEETSVDVDSHLISINEDTVLNSHVTTYTQITTFTVIYNRGFQLLGWLGNLVASDEFGFFVEMSRIITGAY